MSLRRAAVEQYWLVWVAAAIPLLVLPWIGLAPCEYIDRNHSFQCHVDGITEFLAIWWMTLMVLGPIPVLRYQFREVRRGELDVASGIVFSVLGSVVSNVVGFLVTVAAMYFGERFAVLSMYTGDSALGAVGLFIIAGLSICAAAIVAALLLWLARLMRPKDERRSSP
jgi:predicted secreted protein